MPIKFFYRFVVLTLLILAASTAADANDAPPGRKGYYRYPALVGDTLVFTSEGDLWSVDVHGGIPHRLTSGAGTESRAVISADGQTVAFIGQYEGPSDVYTMPIGGGVPTRRTWDGDATPATFAPDGRLLVSTTRFATLPDAQLVLLGARGERERLPLAEGSEATYSADARTLYFTRWRKQPSYTKRYQGGTAESIWSFDGTHEATLLTADWTGTSHAPMFANGRIYFLSDRDGIMNVWSMDGTGHALKQESHQKVFDVTAATVSGGRVVYASGADLWSLEPAAGREQVIPLTLVSDFDQLREHWVQRPVNFLSDVHLSPDGSSAVFTARGEVFTLPAKPSGRIVKVAGTPGVRYRDGRFMPDGKSIMLLSSESGETEFWRYPANGVGASEQLTHDAKVLRWDGTPSPDGHYLAHRNKDQELWLYDFRTRTDRRIAQSMRDDFVNLAWSTDSRWLAYVETADNLYQQIRVLNLGTGVSESLTSDRYNSSNPVFSVDGKWLYFLSDRALKTAVESPWGSRAPEPHFARPVKLYELALTPGTRSPFLPPDELHPEATVPPVAQDKPKVTDSAHRATAPAATTDVRIDFPELAQRTQEVPTPAGNFHDLAVTDKRLCWLDASDEAKAKSALQCLDIGNKGDEVETVTGDVKSIEFSRDRKKLLIAKEHDFYVVDADVKAGVMSDPKASGKAQINLSRWQFSTTPRAEFRGIFLDAWRLERDYFYDRHMHGIDWPAMKTRYLPLVDRVSDRAELNEVIAQMVGELSTLHIFVYGGDARHSTDGIDLASLGALLTRDDRAGGLRVDHVYRGDPDQPGEASPLSRPESQVREGEIIVGIDGEPALGAADERALLRGKAGVQVLLHVRATGGEPRDVLVTPMRVQDEAKLRYADWEYSRRQTVETEGGGKIGYVHLRAMGAEDIEQWARDYYPVFNRQGLIIDVRHNRGGNIDSWLLEKLLRQAWFFWQPRVGDPMANMQYAFRGYVVVLCDEHTASDGEAFTEGFRHFQLGKVIGRRTWGGEIWLSGENFEADGGIATAAEIGVYAGGKWLIEGHGVDPDIVVDNLPHDTAEGHDAQLQSAINLLKESIRRDPRPIPSAPPYPNKAFTTPP